ncbi:orotidine-5'-phosphate decarboxylase [Collinsella sp. AGMB00827]|uniref:Orotidine 5'-phosphate decarboxylase n=1 Tax=Collinsella ureilytica TaxID=2869515 RepID=A0ABS7MKR6_9ACTN|nr:orotidine-5'-phosphate decarboxylase [Collinsella urealyticum]MBY4797959.1 orotidine-5'-phosphate decarboxylase [Collinsella urealyticum]
MLEGSVRDQIIVALDCDHERALSLGQMLAGKVGWVKVGMTLFYSAGPAIVSQFKDLGLKVFVDLKIHDIPHQVEGAVRAAALTGADLMTVHGLGGSSMLKAARRGVEAAGTDTRLIAVTILTSMDETALREIGVDTPLAHEVDCLARLAHDSEMDGVVCSPQEAARMRSLLGAHAWVVTPGVRPQGASAGDQSRIATPAQAVALGASHIVVGRPIVQADDPVCALEGIVRELSSSSEAV